MKEDEVVRILLQRKIVTTEQVRECIDEAVTKGGSVLDLLLVKRYVTPEHLDALRGLSREKGVEQKERRLGGVRLLRTLGHGKMGTIYEAEQLSLGRKVALKVLPSHFAEDEEFIERFSREARAAAAVNHPNIVSVIDFGVADGTYYIAMEFVEGENLRDMIKRRGVVPEREALKFITDIAGALEAAWAAGIVHRDIKPHNIIVTRDGVAKLCDLGLAKKRQSEKALTQPGQIIGSPQYMAPEQIEDSSRADVRSDIYSLGITLFHLVTGRPPYEGNTVFEIMAKQVKEPLPNPLQFNPRLSPSMVTLIKRMTEKNPSRRYQTPTQLLEDLRRLAAGKPLSKPKARAPKPASAAPRPPAPRRAAPVRTSEVSTSFPTGVVVVLAILLVGGIVVFSTLSKGRDDFSSVEEIEETPQPRREQPSRETPTSGGGEEDTSTPPDTEEDIPSSLKEIFQKIDQQFGLQPEMALIQYNTMYEDARSAEFKKLIKRQIERYAGRLVLELKEKVENATELEELLTLKTKSEELEDLLEYSDSLSEVRVCRAEINNRLQRFMDVLDKRVRELIKKKDFATATKELEKIRRIGGASAVVERLERLLKEEEKKAEAERLAELKRRLEQARMEIINLLASFDINAAKKRLTALKKSLPEKECRRMETLITATDILKETVLSGMRKSLGTSVRIVKRDGKTVSGTLERIKEKSIVVSDMEIPFGEVSPSTFIDFAMRGTTHKDQRFLSALLLYSLEFDATAEDVAKIFEMAKEVGVTLPEDYKKRLATKLLEESMKEAKKLMARRKFVDAGKSLSLALSQAEDADVPAAMVASARAIIEECIKESGIRKAFKGKVDFKEGMVSVVYDFKDPKEFGDWEPIAWKKGEIPPCRWEVTDGALLASGKGELKWKPRLKGDVKVIAIITPHSDKKTFYIQVCNSGEGVRSSSYVVGFAWRNKVFAGVDKRGRRIYREGPERHFITKKSPSKTRKPKSLAVAELPKLTKGNSFTVVVHRRNDEILVWINGRQIMRGTDKAYTKGYVTLFPIDSTLSFEKIEVLCNPDPVWLNRQTR